MLTEGNCENKVTNPDSIINDFLANEGTDIVIIPSQVKLEKKYTYKFYGNGKAKRRQRNEIAILESWLEMPYIFDECSEEYERWERTRKAAEKYGESVRIFLNQNRINPNVIEKLLKSMEYLLRNYAHYNRENFIINEKVHHVINRLARIYREFQEIITASQNIKGAGDEIREKLRGIEFFKSREITQVPDMDYEGSIPHEIIREKIMEVMQQLENICLHIIKIYKKP